MHKYSDFRTNLDVHPITGDLLLFTDEQAITSQIKNLIYTDFYEVLWNPTMAAGIPQTLFDNFGNDTEYQLRIRIEEVINRHAYERAKLLDVKIKYDNHNAYSATIVYQPLNTLTPVTIAMILTRTR